MDSARYIRGGGISCDLVLSCPSSIAQSLSMKSWRVFGAPRGFNVISMERLVLMYKHGHAFYRDDNQIRVCDTEAAYQIVSMISLLSPIHLDLVDRRLSTNSEQWT
jgi:hypothetical protein